MTPTPPDPTATSPAAIDPAPLELIRNTSAGTSSAETTPDGADTPATILSAIRPSAWPD
ncbi:MAG: hypothetical protein NC212_03450 [Staphylococcus sp.]|nr:hypothetical protein [Staphylococcus sp.]